MLMAEMLNLIKIEITGKLVAFEMADADVETVVRDAIRRARTWYVEGFRFETVPVYGASAKSSQFIKTTDFQKTPSYIQDIWSANASDVSDLSGLALVSNLIGVSSHLLFYTGIAQDYGDTDYSPQNSAPGQSVYDDWFMTYTNYLSLRPGLMNLVPSLEWEWDKNRQRLWLSGTGVLDESKVTVVYGPLPQNLEDVTFERVISWIQDYSIAKIKVALGRGRGKYRTGGLNFETDAMDLISEGNEKIRELEEQLKILHFVNPIER